MLLEREPKPEYPYACPNCGANLEEPGAVIAWIDLPARSVGHIESGVGDGLDYVLDQVESLPPISLECANCGEELKDLVVEDIFTSIDCEFEENTGEEE